MILAFDTSALVTRFVDAPHRQLVLDTMAAADHWCASTLCRTETLMVLHRVASDPYQQQDLWRSLRDDWEAIVEVPVDDRCLARASEIGATYRVRVVDAIHLAAADRLPRPVSYLTLDPAQIPAASGLGFQVIAPLV